MSESPTDLILSLTPADGAPIGNGAMLTPQRERVPSLADDDNFNAQVALVKDGALPYQPRKQR